MRPVFEVATLSGRIAATSAPAILRQGFSKRDFYRFTHSRESTAQHFSVIRSATQHFPVILNGAKRSEESQKIINNHLYGLTFVKLYVILCD